MKPWNERPFEIRNLFNPAFCGVVLLRALEEFQSQDESGMPFSLCLLVLPLCLHKESRETILNNSRSHLLKIVSANPQMLIGLAKRTTSLLPFSFEAMGFTYQLQSFEVTDEGKLKILKKGIRKKVDGTEESIDCQKAAKIIGRQFARIGDRVTIYTTFGIRP